MDIYSPFAIRGPVDGQYGLVFAQFGLVGILYLFLIQGYLLSFIREMLLRPLCFRRFLYGGGFFLHGIVEYLLYSRRLFILSVSGRISGFKIFGI